MYTSLKLKPLSVNVCASSTAFHSYASGVFNDVTCYNCGFAREHLTNIVGYGFENNVAYWMMRNSWGVYWGENGYMKVQVQATGQSGICGI